MKVSCNSKTKLDEQAKVALHVIPENSNAKCAVTEADGHNSLEKRKKEEAKKPLYLKRV